MDRKIHDLEGQLVFLEWCGQDDHTKEATRRVKKALRLLRKQQRRDSKGRRRDRLYAK
jgi:hypothetical protein